MVCAEGSEQASVATGWASASRAAGATVSVCPPGFLDSHAKASSGTYDLVVVEGGEGVGDAVLEGVRMGGVRWNLAVQGGGGRGGDMLCVLSYFEVCMHAPGAGFGKPWPLALSLRCMQMSDGSSMF